MLEAGQVPFGDLNVFASFQCIPMPFLSGTIDPRPPPSGLLEARPGRRPPRQRLHGRAQARGQASASLDPVQTALLLGDRRHEGEGLETPHPHLGGMHVRWCTNPSSHFGKTSFFAGNLPFLSISPWTFEGLVLVLVSYPSIFKLWCMRGCGGRSPQFHLKGNWRT